MSQVRINADITEVLQTGSTLNKQVGSDHTHTHKKQEISSLSSLKEEEQNTQPGHMQI